MLYVKVIEYEISLESDTIIIALVSGLSGLCSRIYIAIIINNIE